MIDYQTGDATRHSIPSLTRGNVSGYSYYSPTALYPVILNTVETGNTQLAWRQGKSWREFSIGGKEHSLLIIRILFMILPSSSRSSVSSSPHFLSSPSPCPCSCCAWSVTSTSCPPPWSALAAGTSGTRAPHQPMTVCYRLTSYSFPHMLKPAVTALLLYD